MKKARIPSGGAVARRSGWSACCGCLHLDWIEDNVMSEVFGKDFVDALRTAYFGCFISGIVEMATALVAAKKVKQVLCEKPWTSKVLLVKARKRRMAKLIFRRRAA
ncbi:hypothetical protein Q4S45_08390 [Massilia sp. R2A-15]|uniref:hypothetical protein n=1 Tax=Massilia sp. R2A-15 TaxID=3064278 RepID=UPI002736F33C|nr:hypothetical protein [Massilia sp. R2A-15]WLI91124.1 hypothetical protein Q4S45_08390 [Massilia sp. R2A-15]